MCQAGTKPRFRLTTRLACRFRSTRFDTRLVRAYIVSAIMPAVDFWILGAGFHEAIWSAPRPLFADEPSLPLAARRNVVGRCECLRCGRECTRRRVEEVQTILAIVGGDLHWPAAVGLIERRTNTPSAPADWWSSTMRGLKGWHTLSIGTRDSYGRNETVRMAHLRADVSDAARHYLGMGSLPVNTRVKR